MGINGDVIYIGAFKHGLFLPAHRLCPTVCDDPPPAHAKANGTATVIEAIEQLEFSSRQLSQRVHPVLKPYASQMDHTPG
jgi:hypothetical protein